MKVSAVSGLKFRSTTANNTDSNFLYTKKQEKKTGFREHKYEYIGGILAAVAAICCLHAFKAKKIK